MPGRRAVFWQHSAQSFTLLQIDWGNQVPPAEQLPRHVHQQKWCSPSGKSAPRLFLSSRKRNFLPARGWARALVPATAGWATARWGLCGRAALAEASDWDQENPSCFPCLQYQAHQRHDGPFLTPLTLYFIYLWEKILKADCAFNASASKQTCLIVLPRKSNFKWRPHVLLQSYYEWSQLAVMQKKDPNTHLKVISGFQVLSCSL